MKKYRVVVTPVAKNDLRKYAAYLRNVKKNRQAARSVVDDFYDTKSILSTLASSIREPDSEKLKARGLKKLNFKKHDYLMLFRIDGNKAVITNVFHSLENYENKLR